jgi:TonB family protein
MSYKSLLFCPEEKTARLVTQVLSELEFTVELSNEPNATAQKLTDEHFDALVADIANEQDAALLFKSARNSELNHSSLSVAVVEGQAGVAKAFRIGANLVLTKPINIEQSKGTLRVARGLLRKNEAKVPSAPVRPTATAIPATVSPKPFSATPAIAAAPVTPALHMAQTPTASSTDAPFSSFEVEKEPTPAPEPAEAALLESMQDPSGSKPIPAAEQTWAPKLKSSAEPIAASTASQAAAGVAPALEKPVEIKSAPPLASQEPITAVTGARETFEPAAVPVPTFSYGQNSGSGKKTVKTFVMLVLMAVAGYTAWQRLQLGQYLQNLKGTRSTNESELAKPTVNISSAPSQAAAPAKAAPSPGVIFPDMMPTAPEDPNSLPALTRNTEHASTPETIQVDELPMGPEPKITVTPKPQPLVVKSSSGGVSAKPIQPAPPALTISPSTASSEALARIVTSAAPKPTLQALRVSQGVSQGLLIKKVAPVYPSAALQMRKQGLVELMATVGKDGAISGIKVLSGDAMLAKAATDAVRQWKYHPYLLNGEPVEIETQITVSFKVPH